MRKRFAILALAGLVGLLAAGPAVAAGLAPPVADCYKNQRLTHSYTAAQLKTGLNTMPAYIREYSDCYDVLQQALLQKIGKLGSGGSSAGSSFLPTWLIVVLAVLVVGGVALGVVAVRNRGSGPGPG